MLPGVCKLSRVTCRLWTRGLLPRSHILTLPAAFRSSYASLFSDESASDDEIDVERREMEMVREGHAGGTGGGGGGRSRSGGDKSKQCLGAAGADACEDSAAALGDAQGWRSGRSGSRSGSRRSQAGSSGSGGGSHEFDYDALPAAKGAEKSKRASGVDHLIETHGLTIDVDAGCVSACRGVAPASAWPPPAGLEAIPASPGDVLPMLLNAMQDRRHLDDDEVSAICTRKQKQRAVDVWLEVAMGLQRQNAALRELTRRRRAYLSRNAFFWWRRWLDQDDDDGDSETAAGGAEGEQLGPESAAGQAGLRLVVGPGCEDARALSASVSSSPAGEYREMSWDLLVHRDERLRELSALSVCSVERSPNMCFAEKSRQSMCSEESFCGDTRSGPSLAAAGIGQGPLELKDSGIAIGGSVDRMTVASEASTRSLGSEQSTMSVSWLDAAQALPHKSQPDNVPPSPGSRSAEAQLEASKRAMESLLWIPG